MIVTKQQQLEWLAKSYKTWPDQGSHSLRLSAFEVGKFAIVNCHIITRKEWQQERDKMQKQQDNSWHECGELPPVGCECEVFDGDDWLQSFIVGRSRFGDVVVQTRNGYFEASHAKFRPLRTEREKAIDAACAAVGGVGEDGLLIIERLYDAGMLK